MRQAKLLNGLPPYSGIEGNVARSTQDLGPTRTVKRSTLRKAFPPTGDRKQAEEGIFRDRRTGQARDNRKELATTLPPMYWDELL